MSRILCVGLHCQYYGDKQKGSRGMLNRLA